MWLLALKSESHQVVFPDHFLFITGSDELFCFLCKGKFKAKVMPTQYFHLCILCNFDRILACGYSVKFSISTVKDEIQYQITAPIKHLVAEVLYIKPTLQAVINVFISGGKLPSTKKYYIT